MKSLLESTRAFPKFDMISLASSKKLPKFAKDGCHVDLIWMGFIVEYLLSYIDGVGNDNDFGSVFFAICLTNTASHSEEFHFCVGDEGYMMNCLDQRVVAYVNV